MVSGATIVIIFWAVILAVLVFRHIFEDCRYGALIFAAVVIGGIFVGLGGSACFGFGASIYGVGMAGMVLQLMLGNKEDDLW